MKYWWHKHWRAPVIGVVAFFIGGAIGLSAKTETKTVTTTVSQITTVPGPVRVRTTTGQAEQPAPAPAPSATPASSGGDGGSGGGGGGTQHYQGSGLTRLGTITVPSTSTLEWTASRGGLHIFDDENSVEVDSQRSSGRTVLNGGTYHHFLVNSAADWTITIRPQ